MFYFGLNKNELMYIVNLKIKKASIVNPKKVCLSVNLFIYTLQMNSVNPDNFSLQHPSIFQNPAGDLACNNPETAKNTNPYDMWFKKLNKNGGGDIPYKQDQLSIVPDPNDPPLSKKEKRTLMAKMDPIINITFDLVIPTLLFYTFFSRENARELQKKCRYLVHDYSGYNIAEPSILDLKKIMEDVYEKYVQEIDENDAPSQFLFNHIRKQISRLNKFVLEIAVPIIVNQVTQHMGYLKQLDNPFTINSLNRSQSTSITGTMQYRSSSDIFK